MISVNNLVQIQVEDCTLKLGMCCLNHANTSVQQGIPVQLVEITLSGLEMEMEMEMIDLLRGRPGKMEIQQDISQHVEEIGDCE